MIRKHNDIDDDEIRIISSVSKRPANKSRKHFAWLCGVVSLIVIGVITAILLTGNKLENIAGDGGKQIDSRLTHTSVNPASGKKPYTERKDTSVNGIGLSIFTPHNAAATLQVGPKTIKDTTAVLIAQAADVRGDNGEIAGTFVVNGELVGKGEAKAGFCSIINGEITVGVADATPMLEEALRSEGYFFRQYPLVVGGQIVENKPRGKAIRKALAEIGGRISVIASNERVSLHDFSQALTDAGVSNAIYLVGGNSYCVYKDASGARTTLGRAWDRKWTNVNYLVWR